MNWNKIKIQSVLAVLRNLEDTTFSLDYKEHAIVYSDGKEEVKISYRRLKE